MSAAKVPAILVSGIAEQPMAAATIALQWDLPSAVVVRHDVDPEREVLTRTVSDLTGLLEEVEIDVDHACVSCAIRNDVVPTLERLAAAGRWGALIAHLPITADPVQVCRAVAMFGTARRTCGSPRRWWRWRATCWWTTCSGRTGCSIAVCRAGRCRNGRGIG